jgi:hypothetical protein
LTAKHGGRGGVGGVAAAEVVHLAVPSSNTQQIKMKCED